MEENEKPVVDQMARRPLDGIRIIDLTTVVAAPTCSQLLADFGADVIKIEALRGDDSRSIGVRGENGLRAHFVGLNRNKRSVAIDLAQKEGQQTLLTLLEDADVFLDNLKPGSLKKWGLDYEGCLKERFPHLIHCSISGFGSEGPLGGLPGYDAVAQAFSGIMSFSGEEDGDPLRVCLNVVDTTTGIYAAAAIAMALYERRDSGLGQAIDLALFDSAFTLMHPFAANWLSAGITPKRMGSRHPDTAPYDVYPVADGHILLCVANNVQFGRLCKLLGVSEWITDERFKNTPDRLKNMAVLTELMKDRLKDKEKMSFALDCLNGGVAAAPVLNMDESMTQPHLIARQMIIESGDYKGVGVPIKMSRTPAALTRKPAQLGEHTREVLREAGYTEDLIADLIDRGVLKGN